MSVSTEEQLNVYNVCIYITIYVCRQAPIDLRLNSDAQLRCLRLELTGNPVSQPVGAHSWHGGLVGPMDWLVARAAVTAMCLAKQIHLERFMIHCRV